MTTHRYESTVEWTGNTGTGTRSYRGYDRSHDIGFAGRPTLLGSSDRAFRGDPARHSPEDLLLAAVSACHMLWFLHLCSEAAVTVVAYRDDAEGVMEVGPDGGGRFTRIVLRPSVTVAGAGRPRRCRRAAPRGRCAMLRRQHAEHPGGARAGRDPLRAAAGVGDTARHPGWAGSAAL